MTIAHHPSDIILAEFATGTMDEAATVVVAMHVARCSECQRTVRQCEALGGAVLDDMPASPMLADDAEALLQRIDAIDGISGGASAVPEPVRTAPSLIVALDPGTRESEQPLYERGKWRWAGPGVQWCPVSVPSDSGIRVFMLKASAGVRLLDHRHSGIEWTCVLEGAFRHSHGRFGPGDFDEADSDVEHDPVVEEERECICIVAMSGQLQLQGFFGKLMQPLVRF
jgi:putative transcriptional regulator